MDLIIILQYLYPTTEKKVVDFSFPSKTWKLTDLNWPSWPSAKEVTTVSSASCVRGTASGLFTWGDCESREISLWVYETFEKPAVIQKFFFWQNLNTKCFEMWKTISYKLRKKKKKKQFLVWKMREKKNSQVTCRGSKAFI